MSLPSGGRLGGFEIRERIGEGGMGEVYRARDHALKRDVAIKIIRSGGVRPDELHARLTREARLLASLNHPHIASIYGLVEDTSPASGTVRGLVMEFVEGPTLADRIATGPMQVRDASKLARDIALALEAAHDAGIVHRDLKPGNVKLTRTGGAKVLDFGIAKARFDDTAADATTTPGTEDGAMIGTLAYMSPEQARGEPVDARADIWAFGCVLYEMLTGRRAFAAPSAAETLAQILKSEPDWTALDAVAPPLVGRLVRRCLQKDPARRLRSITDARFDLEEPPDDPIRQTERRAPTKARLAIGAVAIAAVAGTAAFLTGRTASSGIPATTSPAIVAGLPEPPGESIYQFVDPLKISPDGTRFTIVTLSAAGKSHLWLQSLDRAAPERVVEGDGAMFPFWSPDSRSLGFCADGRIRIKDLISQAVRDLAPAPGLICGGAWNRAGQILVVSQSGLGLIAASGGSVRPLTTVDAARGELIHGFPQFLPDGRHFLFFVIAIPPARSTVGVGSIDDGDVETLGEFASMPVFAAPGYLLFARGSDLVVQRFDPDRRRIEGEPTVIGGGLMIWSSTGTRGLTISDTGTLVFAPRRVTTTQMTWFERSGRPVGTLGEPAEWTHVALSPDGRTVAAEQLEAREVVAAIWTGDVARNVMTRFTSPDHWNFAPIWSPDGNTLVFASTRHGIGNLELQRLDQSGNDTVVPNGGLSLASDWYDNTIVLNQGGSNGGGVATVGLGGDRKPSLLVANGIGGVISPDRQWLAYTAIGSGRMEVFVRAVTGGRAMQISRAGGAQPRWRRDGRELFFVSHERRIMAVAVTGGASFTAADPQILPIDTPPDLLGNRRTYDVTADGQRFLIPRPVGVDPTPPIAVILNWQEMLKK